MATEYINALTGSDSNSGATPALAWLTTQKANTSATATDTIQAADGTYNADGTGGYGQTYHNLTKALLWTAANTGSAVLTNTGTTNPVAYANSLANGSTITFTGLVFDAQNATQLAFSNGDMAGNAWTITHTNCHFKNPTIRGNLLSGLKIGTFSFTGCTFSVTNLATGGGSNVFGLDGSANTLGASGTVSVAVTSSILNITSASLNVYGIYQDVSGVPGAAITYTIDGLTGSISCTDATHSAIAVYNKISGCTITNSTNLTVSAASSSATSYGILVLGFSAGYVNTSPVITNNKLTCNFPTGFGISLGFSTSANFTSGGTITGNSLTGAYYASSTPHGIAVGQSSTVGTFKGNIAQHFYANYLASLVTSGTASGNISKDAYGVDFYAKGCTAFTYKGNTAIQTGLYARRNLAPFSVDSQGGTATTATTFDSNTFICAESDTTRIGALANITVNSSATFTGNTYIIPDTIPDSTILFYVGGSEGGRAGATGYTITQWRTGTAGSVAAANGTGTISVSGETIIKMPASVIQALISSSSRNIMSFPLS